MTNNLITSIVKQLNIPKSADSEWICQSVYSVAGQMALASLFDYGEEDSYISIQHFKNRISQIFDAYESLYPKIGFLLPADKTDLLEEMYSVYLRTGFIYHSNYQLSPSVPLTTGYGNITLHRDCLPNPELFMSGLGLYSVQKCTSDATVQSVFGLQEQSFEDYFEELLSHSEWEPIDWPEDTEFLRLNPPFSKGYWQKSPDKTAIISLARYGNPNKIFVFYQYVDGRYQQKSIPEWRIQDYFSNDSNHRYGEYRRIAVALLKQYGTLPEIKVKTTGDLVEIKLGYRFPPSEEEFFKLYSWPLRYDFTTQSPQVFARKMAKQIYPVFKHIFEAIGYRFVEE